tara:strand:+ start:15 stop:1370 length:1356 start_codon:yes stop_codon:yes gene_type:complete
MSKIEVNTIEPQCGTTLTLGGCGQTVALGSGASQTGFGRTGTVDWDTSIKTGTVTAATGKGYFVNTTAGVITVNLPAGVVGSIVAVSDYASTAASNNITIAPNGSDKINGTNASYKIRTAGLAVTLVYADAVRGWKSVTGSDADSTGLVPVYVTATVSGACNTLTTSGDYKLATFLGPGTFCVSTAGNPAGSDTITTTTVAGAAGGGARGGGGGGAGGLTAGQLVPVSIQGYPVVVGGGGAGSPGPGCASTAGSNSTSISFTSLGGGVAGSQGPAPTGQPGGSGGGAATGGVGPAGPNPGGSASQPGQGQPAKSVLNVGSAGGSGSANPGPDYGGGGGGGATSVGLPACAPAPTNSDGGAGKDVTPYFNLSPSLPNSGVYAGGGGGGIGSPTPGRGGSGGTGGGGAGGFAGTSGSAATINTGGGGGAGTGVPGPGGNGGSGIVIIEYKFQN